MEIKTVYVICQIRLSINHHVDWYGYGWTELLISLSIVEKKTQRLISEYGGRAGPSTKTYMLEGFT